MHKINNFFLKALTKGSIIIMVFICMLLLGGGIMKGMSKKNINMDTPQKVYNVGTQVSWDDWTVTYLEEKENTMCFSVLNSNPDGVDRTFEFEFYGEETSERSCAILATTPDSFRVQENYLSWPENKDIVVLTKDDYKDFYGNASEIIFCDAMILYLDGEQVDRFIIPADGRNHIIEIDYSFFAEHNIRHSELLEIDAFFFIVKEGYSFYEGSD